MMIQGIQLTLMIGPAVPVPVSRDVLDALDSIKVNTYSGDTQSGFELTFKIDKRSQLQTLFLLTGGASIPLVRVLIVATLSGLATVLIDGVMTHHQMAPGGGNQPSTLTIQGKDLSAVMGYIDFSGIPYPAMPPVARVALIVAKYAWLGIVPKVIPSLFEDIPLPIDRIPRQQGKDLDYVTKLAKDVGYVFYMEPGPAPGVSFAYWGPEIKVGQPQPALNVDMDAHTNVNDVSFSYDKEAKEFPIVFIHNQATKVPIPIPIPDVSPLNPPLGAVPPLPPKVTPLNDTAHLSPLQAIMRGVAYASQHSDVVTATGSLDVLRYGRVLKSRQLVGLRGVGAAFDGLYYVASVTHDIKRGSYTQSFTMKRNGLLSTVPTVPA